MTRQKYLYKIFEKKIQKFKQFYGFKTDVIKIVLKLDQI